MHITAEKDQLVSVVIPVRNGRSTLDLCLRAIKRSYYKNIEVVVVDDHSTDNTVEIAKKYDCRIITAEENAGANAARNLGAASASGEILVFIDSDIVIARETILGIVERLEEDFLDAIVGIYTAKHRHESLVSQYKNLWVRYSYIKSPPAIDWLFGAISGIKKQAFLRIGGFNPALLAMHGNDDIELGKRFVREKLRIELDMEIEVEHLKQYTLWSFCKNEFHRSAGFAELALHYEEAGKSIGQGFVNVYPMFILSTVLSVPLVLVIVAAFLGNLPIEAGIGGVVFYLGLNIRFLNYLEQVRGLFAMAVMVPFLLIDHLACFMGSLVGFLRGVLKKK